MIETRDRDIEFIRENGFASVVTAHLVDGGVDTSKVSISSGSKMVETCHLGEDGLWPADAFEQK